MKITTIVGARPQFIKAASITRELSLKGIEEIIIHTGQHFDYEMSNLFFEEMNISKPKYNLNINSLSHGSMTGRMIEKIENILKIEKPDIVIVYGDTNSTLAGALAAKKLNIPISHVESGLRSYNMSMPEEINRILTDRISDILFCPTEASINNLTKEGFLNFNCKIFNVGDIMYDSALHFEKLSDQKSKIMKKVGLDNNNFVLATIHRQENTDFKTNFSKIIESLNYLSNQIKIIIPIHPRVRSLFKNYKISDNIILIEPVGYLDMIQLIKKSKLIITDSGGLQKEAYFFNKFCITVREETEWVELVNNGYNFIVGSSKEKLLNTFDKLLNRTFIKSDDLYGDGNASKKIVKEITNLLNE